MVRRGGFFCDPVRVPVCSVGLTASSRKLFERIFAEAGLEVVRTEEQRNFPEELFTVQMYVAMWGRRG